MDTGTPQTHPPDDDPRYRYCADCTQLGLRIADLKSERDRLREALERINDASNHYAMTPTYSEGTLRYAHEATRNLAREALLREED